MLLNRKCIAAAKSILSVCLSMVFAQSTFAGSFVGNGTNELKPDHMSAWFLGDFPVRWCLAGANEREVQKSFKVAFGSALKTWVDYIAINEIERKLSGSPIFATQFEFEGECTLTTDLKIVYGQEHEFENEISEAQKLYLSPTSFSHRYRSANSMTQGNGLIWVRNLEGVLKDEKIFEDSLQAILTHELGHVFGNVEVSGTAMDESNMRRIGAASQQNQIHQEWFGKFLKSLHNVDQSKELYFCEGCKNLVVQSKSEINPRVKHFFSNVQSSEVTLRMVPGAQMWILQVGQSTFDLRIVSSIAEVPLTDGRIFKKFWNGRIFETSAKAKMFSGIVIDRFSSTHQFILLRNMNEGIQIKLIYNDEILDFFDGAVFSK